MNRHKKTSKENDSVSFTLSDIDDIKRIIKEMDSNNEENEGSLIPPIALEGLIITRETWNHIKENVAFSKVWHSMFDLEEIEVNSSISVFYARFVSGSSQVIFDSFSWIVIE